MRLRMTLRNAAMFASPKGVPTYQALAFFATEPIRLGPRPISFCVGRAN